MVFLQFTGIEEPWMENVINIACIAGIATFGVAHGAIDHVLYQLKMKSKSRSNILFIAIYVSVAIVFAGIWYLFPALALVIFLGVSAYHFGQSQFSEDLRLSQISKSLFYLSWGGLVISFMLFFQPTYFLSLKGLDNIFLKVLSFLANYSTYLTFFFLVLFLFFLFTNRSQFKPQQIGMELFILALVACSFYLLPAFVAFSLFFVVIHSGKVIGQEFDFCKKNLKIQSAFSFAKLFMPLTLVSLLSIVLLVLLMSHFSSGTSYIGFALLILLSSITIPHAMVMEKFYD